MGKYDGCQDYKKIMECVIIKTYVNVRWYVPGWLYMINVRWYVPCWLYMINVMICAWLTLHDKYIINKDEVK